VAILKGGAYGSEEEGKNKEEGKKEKITQSVIGCGCGGVGLNPP
jgi:hypothetical protein